MKNPISVAFSVVILLKIISICNGYGGSKTEEEEKSIFELYGDELPAQIKLWKSKHYGLEITGNIKTSSKLNWEDRMISSTAAFVGKAAIEKNVDKLIEENNTNNLPDFTITKMDPMSYKFDEQDMLITFKNIKLWNLDTYDKNHSEYTQNCVYLCGTYNLTPEMHKEIMEKKGQLAKKIKKQGKDDQKYLDRTDAQWTIKLSSKFITNRGTSRKTKQPESKPIIIETEFKIQPDPKANNQEKDNKNPLRARGIVRIEFHDFDFTLTFTITHTQEDLKEFFPPEKEVINLVPDFKAEYNVKHIEVIENSIKLIKYDGDDEFLEETGRENEDVNDNLPQPAEPAEEEKAAMENSESEIPPEENEKKDESLEDPDQKDLVAKHFKKLKELVQNEKKDIEKKLYLNILPKITWKIMRMDTKRQLPFLIYEIMAYNDDFQEKTKLKQAPPSEGFFEGISIISDVAAAAWKGVKGKLNIYR